MRPVEIITSLWAVEVDNWDEIFFIFAETLAEAEEVVRGSTSTHLFIRSVERVTRRVFLPSSVQLTYPRSDKKRIVAKVEESPRYVPKLIVEEVDK